MVNARHSVGRRRSFIKYKRLATTAYVQALFENIVLFPKSSYFIGDFCLIQLFVFLIFHFLFDLMWLLPKKLAANLRKLLHLMYVQQGKNWLEINYKAERTGSAV